MATTVRQRLPTTQDAPARARLALGPLEAHLDPVSFDSVRLIVSELVSNVVRHSGQAPEDTMELEVTAERRSVYGRITDTGPSFHHPATLTPHPPGPDASGWGLVLVDQIATRWGVRHNTPNYVWFELDL
jgi:anti-sigma regulatory factor (Ser/Thr protein kinase)